MIKLFALFIWRLFVAKNPDFYIFLVHTFKSSTKKISKNRNVNLRGACCTCNLHVEYLDLTNIHRKSFYIYNDQMQILFTTFKK